MLNGCGFVFCFFWTDNDESAIATIVIRGATDNIMDDIERAVDDGVNTFKALTKVCVLVFLLLREFIIYFVPRFLYFLNYALFNNIIFLTFRTKS